MTARRMVCTAFLAALTASCGTSPAPSSPSNQPPAAPAAQSPADGAQLTSLRPTLVVTNASTGGTAARTYEFQIADNSGFTVSSAAATTAFATAGHQTGVGEGTGGSTSFTPDFDLQPATEMFWRARYTQDGVSSDWSTARSFKTAVAGFNTPGALYDPLANGVTIGVPSGSTTFVSGQGIRVNDTNSYVRYQLMRTISAGEFSMDIVGLFPEGPGAKLKLFSMMDGTGDLYTSPWLFNVQYRGMNGNPDNAISFKVLLGDPALKLEPSGDQRNANIMSLDPGTDYFWKATWNDGVRVTVQRGGSTGPTIYDLTLTSSDNLGAVYPYAPVPHNAYLGANNGPFGEEDGSWPGVTYRNVWIADHARPASLGTAVAR